MRSYERHFEVGSVPVSLRSNCRAIVDEYTALYASYQCATARDGAVAVEILARRRYPWPRGPYVIQSKGLPGFPVQHRYEVLPHLEWIISGQIIRQRDDLVQLHAATLERHGHALILPGEPGAGKSTLAAALLARGWSYMCDEFALIDGSMGCVRPFPRALCIKEASFPVMKRLGLPLQRKMPYQKSIKGRVGFLDPLQVRLSAVGRPSPIRWVVFPKYEAGSKPKLEPMSRSQAAFELLKQCFNFQVHQERGIAALADVARGADCYRLASGDIFETCELLESCLKPHRVQKAG